MPARHGERQGGARGPDGWDDDHILGDGDFTLLLANAAHVKNVPGRKTDVNDATWLADLLAHGLIRAASCLTPRPRRCGVC
jgi:hypothetical protein